MQTVNIHEAKTQLSKLVEQAAQGESFIIAKAGTCWDNLVQTLIIGVYLTVDIPQPELELLVVLKS